MNEKIMTIANSLSNQDILDLIPLIQDRIGLWDNKGKQFFEIALPSKSDHWHSLNGNSIQIEIEPAHWEEGNQ